MTHSHRQLLSMAAGIAWLSWSAAAVLAGPLIADVHTDRARYAPGDVVTITVKLANQTGQPWSGPLDLRITHHGVPAVLDAQPIALLTNQTATVTFTWTAPPLDYRGYAVAICAGDLDRAGTAIDVSSDWTRYPRYGYLTEFYAGQSAATSDDLVRQLAEDYHITGLQFYDWMWRHEQVIQRPRPGVIADPWVDWRGAAISFAVLEDLIASAHARNVAAMPYFMIYGAREDYAAYSGVSPEWGLYADPNHATQHAHTLDAGSGKYLYVFDPANVSWQNHLLDEVSDTLLTLDFDGIHYDQLGYLSPVYTYFQTQPDLASGWAFRQMINATRTHLDALEPQAATALGNLALTFNCVGGNVGAWGTPDVVANGAGDFLYAEVWGNESYAGVVDFVRWARAGSGGKALVLAAYMNYDEEFSTFNEPSVRLANAVFAVAGAHHLEMGDGQHMLAHEFFPWRRKQMSAGLRAAMQNHYDVITAYEAALLSADAAAVDQGAQWVDIPGETTSITPAANVIWVQRGRTPNGDALHLVNLLGNDDQWRNAANPPPVRNDLAVTFRLAGAATVSDVVVVSPDSNQGLPLSLAYQTGADAIGPHVQFTVPTLEYWSTVLIRRSAAPSPGGRYEAEDAVKTNVSVDTNHPGYSGTGFVDEFLGAADEGVAFSVCAPADGVYDLTLGYANGQRIAASRPVHVDGAFTGDVSFPALSTWDAWGEASLAVALSAGEHDVVIGFGGGTPINLDYLDLPMPAAGLRGQYFDGAAFGDPLLTRIDGGIDFDWNAGTPDPALAGDAFRVRWRGEIIPPVTGRYTFTATADDGVRLFIDDTLVIDAWTGSSGVPATGEQILAAGVHYPLTMVYREDGGDAAVQLAWEAPGLAYEVIPATAFVPAGCGLDDQPPTIPDALSADDVTTNAVTLTWAEATDDLVLGGYRVYRNGTVIGETSAPAFTDTDVGGGATYSYTVRAFDLFGNSSADSIPAQVTLPGEPRPGDFDGDGDVDADDLAGFVGCHAGPGTPPNPGPPASPSACLSAFDTDTDGDIDTTDFAGFQRVFDPTD